MLAVNLAKLGIETSFVDGSSIDAFAAAMKPNDARRVRREPRQPEPRGARHRRRRRGRARARRAADRRQHGAVAVPLQPDPLRRRHRRPLGHQVPRRPRHDAGRRDGRERQVPVGQRQVPGHDRAVEGLPRRQVLRDLRRLRLHDAGAHGNAARLRRGAGADERVADPAGHRDAAAAHGAALRQRPRGRRFLQSHPSVGWVNYPGLPEHRDHGLVVKQMRVAAALPAPPDCSRSASGAGSRPACASSRRRR